MPPGGQSLVMVPAQMCGPGAWVRGALARRGAAQSRAAALARRCAPGAWAGDVSRVRQGAAERHQVARQIQRYAPGALAVWSLAHCFQSMAWYPSVEWRRAVAQREHDQDLAPLPQRVPRAAEMLVGAWLVPLLAHSPLTRMARATRWVVLAVAWKPRAAVTNHSHRVNCWGAAMHLVDRFPWAVHPWVARKWESRSLKASGGGG